MSLRKPANPYGDLELTEPDAMRALAHPVRLAILSRLQRDGAATATELSEHVGASPSVTSWHLRHLARFGLVRDSDTGDDGRKRYWEAVARGFRFEFPDDDEGLAASQVLSRTMFDQAAEASRRWLVETEPGPDRRWRRQSGLSNTRVVVSADELASIEAAVERLLAPYVTRSADERPRDARGVRLLRYTLPEGGDAE